MNLHRPARAVDWNGASIWLVVRTTMLCSSTPQYSPYGEGFVEGFPADRETHSRLSKSFRRHSHRSAHCVSFTDQGALLMSLSGAARTAEPVTAYTASSMNTPREPVP